MLETGISFRNAFTLENAEGLAYILTSKYKLVGCARN